MITINLLPEKKSVWNYFFWVSVGIFILVLILEIGLLFSALQLEQKLTVVQWSGLAEPAGVEAGSNQDLVLGQDWELAVRELQSELKTVEERIGLLLGSTLPEPVLPFLQMLPEGLPELVWLTMIQENADGKLKIQGEGVDQRAIVTWIDYLKLFSGVKQVHLQSLQGTGWYRFALEVEWGEDQ